MHSTQSSRARILLLYANLVRIHLRSHGFRYSIGLFLREILFDLRHRVETVAPIELSSLSVPENKRSGASRYQGTDPRLVKEIFASLPRTATESTFVDYGCGKGRVLILALLHGFKRVVGVEFAPELAEMSRRNVCRVAPPSAAPDCFEVFQGDAADFPPPPGPLTVFLYNPFHGDTLKQVAENLQLHARQHANPVRLLYVNPSSLDVFEEKGFTVTHRIQHRGQCLAVTAEFSPEK
jgi:predicted RNA methylase